MTDLECARCEEFGNATPMVDKVPARWVVQRRGELDPKREAEFAGT